MLSFCGSAGTSLSGSSSGTGSRSGECSLSARCRRLATTGRLMQVVAHPDDEDGGMLTLESRGHGVSTLLMTLNRGEGGQNKIGSNLSDVLGVLRTLELLAADQYYGVQERFSRVADFGFSKSPEETFQKWDGHDVALRDMVRVIRTFRPDVLVARFSGTSRDGHGHHQARRFSRRKRSGRQPTQRNFPSRLRKTSAMAGEEIVCRERVRFWANSCPDADWTVKLNTGEPDALLGMSYIQFAMQGLRHQQSQGAANWSVEPGDRFTSYKLADSVLPTSTLDKDGHEKRFFRWHRYCFAGFGADRSRGGKVSATATGSAEGCRRDGQSQGKRTSDSSKAVEPLAAAVSALKRSDDEVGTSTLSAAAKLDFHTRLRTKLQQAETALNLALNVSLDADVVSSDDVFGNVPKETDARTTVSPGQEFMVAVKIAQRIGAISYRRCGEAGCAGGMEHDQREGQTGGGKAGRRSAGSLSLACSENAEYTRPYWHRDDPDARV